MTKTGPRPLSLQESLHAALRARLEEIGHGLTLGRRAQVIEDICVQLLQEFEGIVPDGDDARLRTLVEQAMRPPRPEQRLITGEARGMLC